MTECRKAGNALWNAWRLVRSVTRRRTRSHQSGLTLDTETMKARWERQCPKRSDTCCSIASVNAVFVRRRNTKSGTIGRFGCERNGYSGPREQLGMKKLTSPKDKSSREATADEQRAMDQHREEHPDGKHEYWDEGDQSLLLARPQLRCRSDGEKLTVPVRIL